MNERIIAPCGIDCTICEMFEKNVTDEFQERISSSIKVPKEMITCKGCANGHQCTFLELQKKRCKTLECVENKKVQYCFECDTFPCEYLMPLADGANKFPQNIKVYNLCLMKRLGVDEWANKSKEIKDVYYSKKLVIGEGGYDQVADH